MKNISFVVEQVTKRPPHLNQSGGALNASYSVVDAVAVVCSKAGSMGLVYGEDEDFYWEGSGYGQHGYQINFSFKDEKHAFALGLVV